jgi:hypothetical protein
LANAIGGVGGLGAVVVASGNPSIWEPPWMSGIAFTFFLALVLRAFLGLVLGLGIAAESERRDGVWAPVRHRVVRPWFWSYTLLGPSILAMWIGVYSDHPGRFLCPAAAGPSDPRLSDPALWMTIILVVPIGLGAWLRSLSSMRFLASIQPAESHSSLRLILSVSLVLGMSSLCIFIFAASIQTPCSQLSPLYWPALEVAGILCFGRLWADLALLRMGHKVEMSKAASAPLGRS